MKKVILISLILFASLAVMGQRIKTPVIFSPAVATGGGGELLNNGTFDSSSNWTLGTYWAITGGQAVYTATAASAMSQTDGNMQASIEPSTTYILEFDIIATDYKTDFYVFDAGGTEYYNLHVSYEGTGTDLQFEFTTPANIGLKGILLSANVWGFTIDNISLTVKP